MTYTCTPLWVVGGGAQIRCSELSGRLHTDQVSLPISSLLRTSIGCGQMGSTLMGPLLK